MNATWKFDKDIANIFDKHAPKHIPDYHYVIKSVPKLLEQNKIKKNDKILEIGCATGATVKILYKAGFKNITATDSSKEMLNLCYSNKMAKYLCTNKIPQEKFQCIIANWTLHFNENKKELLEKIYNSLTEKGLLILSEKTKNNPRNLYHDWKKKQGCCNKEIIQKEASLRNVMHCHSIDWYSTMFTKLGFISKKYNNKLGFYTWILTK